MAAIEHQPSQPQETPGGQGQPITQLEFHQAMHDFKTMFPEMDEDVIEVVLRANNGAVDATIDQLLAMSTDNDNEKLRAELDATENAEVPPRYSPATPPPSYHQAVPYAHSPAHSPASSASQTSPQVASSPVLRRPPTQPRCGSSSPKSLKIMTALSASTFPRSLFPTSGKVLAFKANTSTNPPLSTLKQWDPPLLGPLPSGFLCIEDNPRREHRKVTSKKIEKVTVLSSALLKQRMEENERQRHSVSSGEDSDLKQFLEDERIAIFLQNEEFVQELRRNKEFMTTLERDFQPKTDPRAKGAVSETILEGANDEEGASGLATRMDAFPFTKTISQNEDSDAAFVEKLKNMGKVSRRKFTQLARIFSRRKRKNFRQILGEGGNPSKDNLLLHEDEYSELSEEEEPETREDTWNSHAETQSSQTRSADKVSPHHEVT